MRFDNETQLNAAVRGILRSRGLMVCHVRETDTPGPLDLVVWYGRALVCWIELKVDDRVLETSQKEFIRDNPTCSIVMRWSNIEQRFLCWLTCTRLTDPPWRMTWDEFVNDWSVSLKAWATATNSLIEE